MARPPCGPAAWPRTMATMRRRSTPTSAPPSIPSRRARPASPSPSSSASTAAGMRRWERSTPCSTTIPATATQARSWPGSRPCTDLPPLPGLRQQGAATGRPRRDAEPGRLARGFSGDHRAIDGWPASGSPAVEVDAELRRGHRRAGPLDARPALVIIVSWNATARFDLIMAGCGPRLPGARHHDWESQGHAPVSRYPVPPPTAIAIERARRALPAVSRACCPIAVIALLTGCAYLDSDGSADGSRAQPQGIAIVLRVSDANGHATDAFASGAPISVDPVIDNASASAAPYGMPVAWYLDVRDQLGNLVYFEHRAGSGLARQCIHPRRLVAGYRHPPVESARPGRWPGGARHLCGRCRHPLGHRLPAGVHRRTQLAPIPVHTPVVGHQGGCNAALCQGDRLPPSAAPVRRLSPLAVGFVPGRRAPEAPLIAGTS